MRSLKKGPFLDQSLIRLASQVNNEIEGIAPKGESVIKAWKRPIWSRRSTILPQFVGLKFQIHNGMKFIPITVSEEMIGHRFGEFALTRKPVVHKEKKLKKTK